MSLMPTISMRLRIPALLKCRQSDFEMQSRLPAPIRRDRCKVVKVFRHQCFAIAVDEVNGQGTGAGWQLKMP